MSLNVMDSSLLTTGHITQEHISSHWTKNQSSYLVTSFFLFLIILCFTLGVYPDTDIGQTFQKYSATPCFLSVD